jgi:haloacetate dehalogenase
VFEGFTQQLIDTGEATINVRYAGSGPPVLLLHGFPQTSAMWHHQAPALAEDHTVVLADLRGYGDSSRPPSDPSHAAYSFRAMAGDQVAVMHRLGFERFDVVGHDRGARVAHRLALDHPAAVTRLGLIDILPTGYMYDTVDSALATAYFHWFFFIQPDPIPERLIAGDPIGFLHALLGGWGSGLGAYAAPALAEYERVFVDPDVRHAMMEDYRAAASIDLEHDLADRERRLEVPTLIMWGTRSVVGRRPVDPLAVWRTHLTAPVSAVIDAGHFLVEERPEETLAALRAFLAG